MNSLLLSALESVERKSNYFIDSYVNLILQHSVVTHVTYSQDTSVTLDRQSKSHFVMKQTTWTPAINRQYHIQACVEEPVESMSGTFR